MANEKDGAKELLTPQDGSIQVSANPRTVTEKEIHDDRLLIIQRLDGCYGNLIECMAPMQAEWDTNPMRALGEAAIDGARAGVADWAEDFAQMFDKDTWIGLGDKVEQAAGAVYDTTREYAGEVYGQIADLFENADDTLANWAWWQGRIDSAEQAVIEDLKRRHQAASQAIDDIEEVVAIAGRVWAYRDDILNLPKLIAEGDAKAVQAFVDNTLPQIDKALADGIRNDPNFYVVLEIIQDNDSALAYLSYASLAVEAVPPNFYAYHTGKGGAYLMVEVVLLIVTALLSAGTVAAARIAALAARIATSSAKVAGVVRKVEAAQRAFSAFIRMLDDFSGAANQLHALGAKLNVARQRGLRVSGATRTTITARRAAIKRDRRCRICGSTKHATPRERLGTVEYE
ncbi:hypothetical protein [Denitromonas iodatirespirans]|uniref:Uncharacterized protein n=1 Tax=Denitromonas iodatirespirans TaxID=2795389 RepID=A0A944DJN8_DENI1|nr:hypothetical protein [Denitromonas iodatirespirans]MBT0964173.1 hypothetical protein [Denitromonas iodatirespirans]